MKTYIPIWCIKELCNLNKLIYTFFPLHRTINGTEYNVNNEFLERLQ